MNVLLAHPGTQHAPALARELDRRSLLNEFHTSLALDENGWFSQFVSRWGNMPWAKAFRNRIVRGVDSKRLHSSPWHELRALHQIRLGGDSLKALHERNKRFQEGISLSSFRTAEAIIGFDTSSWILAERSRAFDKPLWLERTINHPRQWMEAQQELHRRYPQWQPKPVCRWAELAAAEDREHQLSHRIVVGSGFVARTLISFGIEEKKIILNPYGVSWEEFSTREKRDEKNFPRDRPFRFLFAGSVGARKGVPILLEAWHKLGFRPKEAELWIVGSVPKDLLHLMPSTEGVNIIGKVAKAEMASIYQQCDVFVLPSFSEGFPLVILEALAAGLSVITTPNTGAADLQVHGAERCVKLVEAGSVEDLMEALRSWKNQPPQDQEVSDACDKLRSRYSWEAYGDRWACLLDGSDSLVS